MTGQGNCQGFLEAALDEEKRNQTVPFQLVTEHGEAVYRAEAYAEVEGGPCTPHLSGVHTSRSIPGIRSRCGVATCRRQQERPTFVMSCCGCCVCPSQESVAIIEQCGKFSRVAGPGCHVVFGICGHSVAGTLSLRVQQLDVSVETKTKVSHQSEACCWNIVGL